MMFNCPALRVVPPPNVLKPVSVSAPDPDFVTLPPELVRAVAQVTLWPPVSTL